MMVINKDLKLDDNEDGRDALGPDLRSGQLAQGLVGNVCQQLALPTSSPPLRAISPEKNMAFLWFFALPHGNAQR